ncbi:hypothetical protein KD050_00140 [Psychrobacillus sp. INOP01]|nr:hypothetical protein [Psychrobacillus sp. INOP01]QUG41753.1 hypothetical protein KD050_00140 [Psychrobacillus sp. INOP01]
MDQILYDTEIDVDFLIDTDTEFLHPLIKQTGTLVKQDHHIDGLFLRLKY